MDLWGRLSLSFFPLFVVVFGGWNERLKLESTLLQTRERLSTERFNRSRRREKTAEYYWVERLLDEFPNVG